MDKMLWSDTQK